MAAARIHLVSTRELLLAAVLMLGAGAGAGWVASKFVHLKRGIALGHAAGYVHALDDLQRRIGLLRAQRGNPQAPDSPPATVAPPAAPPAATDPEPTEDQKWDALGFRKA